MAPKSTQLLRYLTSIQDARPINFSAFLKCLPYEYAQNWQKHFQVAMVAPQKWVVTCTGDVLDQLLLMAQPTQDRAHAASVGDSHRHGNDISFLLVYHEGCADPRPDRSEEHTSELQSRENLVCRLLLEKKNNYLLNLQLNTRKVVSQMLGN